MGIPGSLPVHCMRDGAEAWNTLGRGWASSFCGWAAATHGLRSTLTWRKTGLEKWVPRKASMAPASVTAGVPVSSSPGCRWAPPAPCQVLHRGAGAAWELGEVTTASDVVWGTQCGPFPSPSQSPPQCLKSL